MTDLDVYQPANGQLSQYGAELAVTPEQAKALDEQVRRCTEAVLRENVDYGIIPGTKEKSLWRPGAQKLLQWFRLECICERIEVERDDQGRKHGITYRAEVGKGLKTDTPVILATCEGTADYDETKFYQDVETVRARLREAEHKWAAKDRRVPNADRWNSAKEWRADWNALMKRAQKRAIVGAVNDATAAGGIFTDREEDDHDPAPQDDGAPSYYEQGLDRAFTFETIEAGDDLFQKADALNRRGLISRKQKDHIQNRVRQRQDKLRRTVVVEVEDLAAEAEHAQDAAEDTQEPAQDGDTEAVEDTLPVEDPPDWPEVTKPGTGKPKGK